MGQDVVAAAVVGILGNEIPEPIVPSAAAISLAPGFRFHPTDEELVRYYLTRKVCGKPFRFEAVSEIDLYKSEPWELACHASLKSRDLEWFFFCSLDKKYDNGSRMNRATVQGYWKATGKDRVVRHKSRTIGMKKTAVYHHGRAPDGKRTDWIMHEYRLCDSELEQAGVVQDAFVLCRIFQKSGLGPPNASRYAAFIEEEWNDDDTGGLFVPGGGGGGGGDQEAEDDDTINGDDGLTGGGNELEMIPADDDLDVKKSQNTNSDEPCKRQRANNSSDKSTNTNQLEDLAITTIPSKRKYPIKLFGVNLSESVEEEQPHEEINHPPTDHVDDDANKKKTVEYASKYISILENELGNVTMEREMLKIEVMRAEAMINMLKSRVDLLAHENEDLRKKNMQPSLV